MPRSPVNLKVSSVAAERDGAAPDSDLDAVLRHVVNRFDHTRGPQLPSRVLADDSQEVLELELNGQRYIVIRSAAMAAPIAVTLSPREQEIVRLVSRGLPNKAIAAVLEISSWTVATHLRRIFAKLEVSTRAEMVARALKAGLVMGSESEPDAD